MTVLCLCDPNAPADVEPLPAGIEVRVWQPGADSAEDAPQWAAEVDMLVPAYTESSISDHALARFTALRVVQLLSAGVEPWLGRLPDGVALCSGRGVHGASTAELAIAGILNQLRRLAEFRALQLRGEWPDLAAARTESLDGTRVLVIGAGDIGSRVADVCRTLGAEVTLVARRARDGVHATAELPALLPAHEIVVLAIPRTPQTEAMVDVPFLAAMPDGALLVNVSRGVLVDTDALLAETVTGRLRAFLDVTDPEPLPAGHPLWRTPGVTITPHIGGGTTGWRRRAYALVREQVIALHERRPLRNVVTDGY
ncbi:MAG TPA: 2-hydroxyacid dehydrogenase [Jatrophihabitantaceae bacterium]